MKEDKYYYYLQDLGKGLRGYALEAAGALERSPAQQRLFYEGVLAAYYRVITLMQQQAGGMDIDLATIGLDDIDPDRDLSGGKTPDS